MTQLLEISAHDVIQKINTEAINVSTIAVADKHVRDCRNMPLFAVARQGDVYLAKLLTTAECIAAFPDMFAVTSAAKAAFTASDTETWSGSRHIIHTPHGRFKRLDDQPRRWNRVEDMLSGVMAEVYNTAVQKLSRKLDRAANAFIRNITKIVIARGPWSLQHHEHARIDVDGGLFVISRQLDLATRQFVID